jgi:hypothetical protein
MKYLLRFLLLTITTYIKWNVECSTLVSSIEIKSNNTETVDNNYTTDPTHPSQSDEEYRLHREKIFNVSKLLACFYISSMIIIGKLFESIF